MTEISSFFSNNGLLLRCDAICQHTISSMIIIATTALLILHCRHSKKQEVVYTHAFHTFGIKSRMYPTKILGMCCGCTERTTVYCYKIAVK